jgi:prepilin-type N-terminal cleavage/methylation domain-containing protein
MFRHTFLSTTRAFTLIEIMIVVAIIGILVSIAVPSFMQARTRSQANACIENQQSVTNIVTQWALDEKKSAGALPGDGDLFGPGLYMNRHPQCPVGKLDIVIPVVNDYAVCPNGLTDHFRP